MNIYLTSAMIIIVSSLGKLQKPLSQCTDEIQGLSIQRFCLGVSGTAETIVMDIDIDDHSDSMKCHNSNRRVIHLPPDLSREVSEESSFMTAKPGILKRTGNIHRVVPMPEQSERLPVHRGNSGLWSNENIIKSWPEKIPSHQESRQPSAVSFKNTK